MDILVYKMPLPMTGGPQSKGKDWHSLDSQSEATAIRINVKN